MKITDKLGLLLMHLTLNTSLPVELRQVVMCLASNNITAELRILNRNRFCGGFSKSAAKRRAKHFGFCYTCGHEEHQGVCRSTTRSSQGLTRLYRVPPIKLNAERFGKTPVQLDYIEFTKELAETKICRMFNQCNL